MSVSFSNIPFPSDKVFSLWAGGTGVIRIMSWSFPFSILFCRLFDKRLCFFSLDQ